MNKTIVFNVYDYFSVDIPKWISTNEIYSGMHWAKRKQIADMYHKLVIIGKPKKIIEYPIGLIFECEFKSRPFDSDNCSFICKCIVDGIRRYGSIKDDNYKHINFMGYMPIKSKINRVNIKVVE